MRILHAVEKSVASAKNFLYLVFLIALISALFISVLAALSIIFLAIWIMEIPNIIGKKFNLDRYLRAILYKIINEDKLLYFRDEVMELAISHVNLGTSFDEWGLQRQIDKYRKQAISRLRRGEQIIAIAGGLLAILFGNVFDLILGALIVSIGAIFLTIIVAFRVLVVDVLAYSSIENRHASVTELVKMSAWNKGPLSGEGGIAVVIISVIASRNQKLAWQILDIYTSHKYGSKDGKWEAEMG